jgi:ABC-type branched-subunit amino acid transport system substrate-binding protein
MKKLRIIFCLLLTAALAANAQPVQRHKIAIFSPLYLDSAFDAAGNARFDNKSFPRFLTPGLEFYYGAQMALDSLQKLGAPLEVFVYDTRSKQPLSQQMNQPELRDVELLIGQTNVAETKALAEAAQQKKIPFISATLPNDAGITNNPYFVVLNSSLQAHIEGIYRFLQKNYNSSHIILFRKSGAQEDLIRNHLVEFAKAAVSPALNIDIVDVGADFTPKKIAAKLDSTQKTVCIAGSLDEAFGMHLTQTLASLSKTYPVTVIGMPTWDNFNFSRVTDLDIIYSAPFFYNRTSFLENQLAAEYTARMSNRPGDLFFRGYEATMRFALLLLDTKKDLSSSLTRKGNTVLTQMDIQPVFKDKTSMTLDYFENKHLYFIRVFGGVKNIIN